MRLVSSSGVRTGVVPTKTDMPSECAGESGGGGGVAFHSAERRSTLARPRERTQVRAENPPAIPRAGAPSLVTTIAVIWGSIPLNHTAARRSPFIDAQRSTLLKTTEHTRTTRH